MFLTKCGYCFNAHNLRPSALCPYGCTDQPHDPCTVPTQAVEGIRRTLGCCERQREHRTHKPNSEQNKGEDKTTVRGSFTSTHIWGRQVTGVHLLRRLLAAQTQAVIYFTLIRTGWQHQ